MKRRMTAKEWLATYPVVPGVVIEHVDTGDRAMCCVEFVKPNGEGYEVWVPLEFLRPRHVDR